MGVASLLGCSDEGEVSDEESARLAYLGLDRAVDRAMGLGFDGYNEATSANIPEQKGSGDVSGTMTVGGQVDAGVSNNKEMRLLVDLANYSDGAVAEEDIEDIVYDSDGSLQLDMSMKGLPNADLTGVFNGRVIMRGGLEGPVDLDLDIDGETEDDGSGNVQRKPGTVRVTGTATSDFGVFDVDVTY